MSESSPQTIGQSGPDQTAEAVIRETIPDDFSPAPGYDVMTHRSTTSWVFKRDYKEQYVVIKEASFNGGETGYFVEHWAPEGANQRSHDYDGSIKAQHQGQEIVTSASSLHETLSDAIDKLNE